MRLPPTVDFDGKGVPVNPLREQVREASKVIVAPSQVSI